MVAAVQYISNPAFTNVAASTRTATAFSLGGVPESAGRYVIPYAMFTKAGGRNTTSFTVNGAEAFVSGQQLQTATGSGQAVVAGKPISVPTGTTVDLVHTLDGNWTRHGIGIAVVSGVTSTSALNKFLSFSGTTDGSADGAAIAYPDNGLLLAIHQNTVPSAATFTGVDATPIGDSGTTNANMRGIVRSYAGHTPAETSHAVAGTQTTAGSHILGLYTFAADDGSSTPVTVTLTDMVQGRIVQRTIGATTGNLKVAGTFTGPTGQNPTDAQARVMSGSTVVKDWTTLTNATIDGGGGITGTLPGIPQGDGYTLQLRTRNSAGTVLATANGANTWGVGVQVGLAGSSSPDNLDANDPGTVTLSPLCRKNDVYEGTRWTGNTVGGGIRQIANAILANLPAGVPVGFVCGGIGGSCLTAAANDQSHWEAGSNNYNAYRDRVLSLEGFVEVQIGCVGTNDVRTSAGFQGVATHSAALKSLIDRLRTAFNYSTMPMFWLGGQRNTLSAATVPANATGADGPWTGLKQAEDTFTANNANVYFASSMQADTLGADDIHPIDADYRNIGVRLGRFIAATLFGDTKAYRGPKMTGAVYNSANGIVEVTFDLRGTGDAIVGRTSQEGIQGFRVSTDNFATLQTISSARITAATKVQLVVPTGLSGVKVDYMGGFNAINFANGSPGRPAGNTICGNAAVVAS